MAPAHDNPATRSPTLWPSLLACALTAAWVDLGSIHRQHHSDSLLYPLISLWSWTPFYWGQDRFGMLVPLLARPIAHPLVNLLVQDFLNLFGGLATFLLLARYVLRDAAYPTVGAFGAAAFLALVPPAYQAMYFIDACYGIWMALGLGGLIAVESRPGGLSPARFLCGLILVMLAHWVNFTTALVLGPLAVARWWFLGRAGRRGGSGPDEARTRRPRAWLPSGAGAETLIVLALLAAGLATGRALTSLAPTPVRTPLDALPPYEWPAAWYGLAERHWESLAPHRYPALLACVTAAGLAARAWPAANRRSATARGAAVAMALSALFIWLYTGTRLWSRLNGYTYRYLMPTALLIQASAWTIGVAPTALAVGPTARRGLQALAIAAMFAAAALRFGPPSYSGVRAEIDRKCGALTEDLIAARCTHLAGDYFRAWPAVFHARLVLHERGDDRIIWAVTGRNEATAHLWRAVPPDQMRVAVPIGDPKAPAMLKEYGLPPLRELERRRTVIVLGTPAGPSRRRPPIEAKPTSAHAGP